MKFLILVLSLLSASVFEPSNASRSGASLNGTSGTSPKGPLSKIADSLLSSLFFPGFSTSRLSVPQPIPQVVYLNAYSPRNEPHSDSPNVFQSVSSASATIEQAQDNSEVIGTNEEPITVDRQLMGIASTLQNLMPNITGKFGNLLAKPQRLFGLGSSRDAGFDDVNDLSRRSGSINNKIKRLVGNQISAFFRTILDTIKERLQSIKSLIPSKRQGASGHRSNEVAELENEATVLDILYQIFQSPQVLLQLLPQLIGQNTAAGRQFDASPFHETHVSESWNRTWTKGGDRILRARPNFLNGLTSFKRPSAAGATDHRSRFGFLSGLIKPTTTTTTSTEAPVDQSKATRLINRLLSKTGLRGNAGGAAARADGPRSKFGFLSMTTTPKTTTTTTTTTGAPVDESKATRLINRLLSKTGLRGNAEGAAAGGSRMKKEVDESEERSVDEQKVGEDQTQ